MWITFLLNAISSRISKFEFQIKKRTVFNSGCMLQLFNHFSVDINIRLGECKLFTSIRYEIGSWTWAYFTIGQYSINGFGLLMELFNWGFNFSVLLLYRHFRLNFERNRFHLYNFDHFCIFIQSKIAYLLSSMYYYITAKNFSQILDFLLNVDLFTSFWLYRRHKKNR